VRSLGTLLCDDSHGGATDVAGTHTADFDIEFAHGCVVER